MMALQSFGRSGVGSNKGSAINFLFSVLNKIAHVGIYCMKCKKPLVEHESQAQFCKYFMMHDQTWRATDMIDLWNLYNITMKQIAKRVICTGDNSWVCGIELPF